MLEGGHIGNAIKLQLLKFFAVFRKEKLDA